MQAVSNDNFGPLVAYLVPGGVALAAIRPYSPTLDVWFSASPSNAPTLGAFLYLTVAAIAAGMTVSAIRWAVIDRLHALTGLKPPSLDFSRLQENLQAIVLLIEIHYRHYQFYANMFVATGFWFLMRRAQVGTQFAPIDFAALAAECVFFATARDTLRKYYTRTDQVLNVRQIRSIG